MKNTIKLTLFFILFLAINIILLNFKLKADEVVNVEYNEYKKILDFSKFSDIDKYGFGQSGDPYSVSHQDGNFVYRYNLIEKQVADTKINCNLTYTSNANFTAFTNYNSHSSYKQGWNKFSQKMPVWMISINGFAIQAFSYTSSPVNNPGLSSKYYYRKHPCVNLPSGIDLSSNHTWDEFYNITNKDMIWLLDGYDFCNSMTPIKTDADNIGEQQCNILFGNLKHDEISLLREDGSTLTLRNVSQYKINSNEGLASDRRTGIYKEVGSNTEGFAIVTFKNFKDDCSPLDDGLESPGYNQYSGRQVNMIIDDVSISTEYTSDTIGYYKSREVRYFPGDGLEYVFVEDIAPYGNFFYYDSYLQFLRTCTNCCNDISVSGIDGNLSDSYDQGTGIFKSSLGSFCNSSNEIQYAIAKPTIFYLVAIYNRDKQIIHIDYDFDNTTKSLDKLNTKIHEFPRRLSLQSISELSLASNNNKLQTNQTINFVWRYAISNTLLTYHEAQNDVYHMQNASILIDGDNSKEVKLIFSNISRINLDKNSTNDPRNQFLKNILPCTAFIDYGDNTVFGFGKFSSIINEKSLDANNPFLRKYAILENYSFNSSYQYMKMFRSFETPVNSILSDKLGLYNKYYDLFMKYDNYKQVIYNIATIEDKRSNKIINFTYEPHTVFYYTISDEFYPLAAFPPNITGSFNSNNLMDFTENYFKLGNMEFSFNRLKTINQPDSKYELSYNRQTKIIDNDYNSHLNHKDLAVGTKFFNNGDQFFTFNNVISQIKKVSYSSNPIYEKNYSFEYSFIPDPLYRKVLFTETNTFHNLLSENENNFTNTLKEMYVSFNFNENNNSYNYVAEKGTEQVFNFSIPINRKIFESLTTHNNVNQNDNDLTTTSDYYYKAFTQQINGSNYFTNYDLPVLVRKSIYRNGINKITDLKLLHYEFNYKNSDNLLYLNTYLPETSSITYDSRYLDAFNSQYYYLRYGLSTKLTKQIEIQLNQTNIFINSPFDISKISLNNNDNFTLLNGIYSLLLYNPNDVNYLLLNNPENQIVAKIKTLIHLPYKEVTKNGELTCEQYYSNTLNSNPEQIKSKNSGKNQIQDIAHNSTFVINDGQILTERPIFNLVDSVKVYSECNFDKNLSKFRFNDLDILSGNEFDYGKTLLADQDVYHNFEYLPFNRGRLINENILGKGGNTNKFKNSSILYSEGQFFGGAPRVITNALNANTLNYYLLNRVLFPPSGSNTSLLYSVDNFFENIDPSNDYLPFGNYLNYQGNEIPKLADLRVRSASSMIYFPHAAFVPMAERKMVRNYIVNTSGTILFKDNNSPLKSTSRESDNSANNSICKSIGTFFEYDKNSQLNAIIDPNGYFSTFRFDKDNRMTQINLPGDFDADPEQIINCPVDITLTPSTFTCCDINKITYSYYSTFPNHSYVIGNEQFDCTDGNCIGVFKKSIFVPDEKRDYVSYAKKYYTNSGDCYKCVTWENYKNDNNHIQSTQSNLEPSITVENIQNPIHDIITIGTDPIFNPSDDYPPARVEKVICNEDCKAILNFKSNENYKYDDVDEIIFDLSPVFNAIQYQDISGLQVKIDYYNQTNQDYTTCSAFNTNPTITTLFTFSTILQTGSGNNPFELKIYDASSNQFIKDLFNHIKARLSDGHQFSFVISLVSSNKDKNYLVDFTASKLFIKNARNNPEQLNIYDDVYRSYITQCHYTSKAEYKYDYIPPSNEDPFFRPLDIKSTIYRKIDDINNSFNATGINNIFREVGIVNTHSFDYNITKTEYLNNSSKFVGYDYSYLGLTKVSEAGISPNTRLQTTFDYNVFGETSSTILPNNTFNNLTTTIHDISELVPVPLNPDIQLIDELLIDLNSFYGFFQKKVTSINDITNSKLLNVDYFDALGRLRISANYINKLIFRTYPQCDSHKDIQYNYDKLNRITEVFVNETFRENNDIVNIPKKDIYRYWYDDYGRIKYKFSKDLGITSYAYDKVGNIRFMQNQQQRTDNRVTFYEYDDLNRPIIIGESKIDIENPTTLEYNPEDQYSEDMDLSRLSDLLNPDILNDNNTSDILTANKTIWMNRVYDCYVDPPIDYFSFKSSSDINTPTPVPFLTKGYLTQFFGTTGQPQKVIYSPAYFHNDRFEVNRTSNIPHTYDFENIQWYPDNVKMAYHYDEMPYRIGTIWSSLADNEVIKGFTPTGEIRNLKGKVATIAYREKGSQPFNYYIYSYDPRGRVEAIIKYTDNLGFDIIHYTYNSLNLVTSVRSFDLINEFGAYYSYNDEGKVQNVTYHIQPNGHNNDYVNFQSHLQYYYDTPTSISSVSLNDAMKSKLENNPDITIEYDLRDLVSKINYSQDNLSVFQQFDELKRIKDILYQNTTPNSTQDIYHNILNYDFQGNITKSEEALRIGNFLFESKPQTSNPAYTYNYNCDNFLIDWQTQFVTTDLRPNSPPPVVYNYHWNYSYDALGNRSTFSDLALNTNNLNYTYSASQPNQLTNITAPVNSNTQFILTYNNNGALDTRKSCVSRNGNAHLTHQKFSYDYRGLLTKFEFGEMDVPDNTFNEYCTFASMADFYNQNEWQYRMNPSGEREQKRMYRKYHMVFDFALPWEYYQLGANNEQLVVYHGINLNTDPYLTAPNQNATNPVAAHHEWGCDENSPETKSALFIFPVEFNISAPGVSKMRLVLDENGNWKKEFLVKDQVGTTKALVENIDGMPQVTNRYIYGPYGEPLHYDNEKERQGFIGKEKDLESGLADHGVRKYDYISGRFTSTDPLWEKYMGLMPYQYSANNPVGLLDRDGREIIKQNISNNTMNEGWDKSMNYLKSLNSPTINKVLELAEGNQSKLYINSFSDTRPVESQTNSNVGRSKAIEEEWNSQQNSEGITLKSPKKNDRVADIVISSEALIEFLSNPNGYAPLIILDELNHGVSKTHNKQQQEHQNLYLPLLQEIETGVITVPEKFKREVELKAIFQQ